MSSLFNSGDVLSWSNREEAKKYIGEEGYFADSLENLEEIIKNRKIHTLVEIGADVSCFFSKKEHEYSFRFGLFLPVDKVLPVPKRPKKYRPFKTIEELKRTLNVEFLDALTFREKCTFRQYCAVFNGFCDTKDELDGVGFGGAYKTPLDLFNHYEWYDEKTEKWMPFGVEE